MKKWKKSFVIIAVLLLTGSFLRLYFLPERKIIHFVNTNEEALKELALDYLSGEKYYLGEPVFCKNVEMKGVKNGDHPIVEFYHSGFGIAPSGVYYGFYYSPDNVPVAILDYDSLLKPSGYEEWMWSGAGDNGGMTKRIKENWFYYEAWF